MVLNLVLGGLLLTRPAPVEPRGRGFDRMVGRIEATLPAEDRPKFRAVLEAERESYAGELAAFRAASRAVDAAMAREPFDPEALRAALATWSERWAAFSLAFTATMVQAMEAVSPAGRAQIAAARREGRR
ncbi:periplasmic heavy metal sensor [Roseicella aerolata]|uniref:periplasmic heavy metal sensor n=1 Tax=Roseicella aerolata TaxID=2883479 RepID=UPI0030841F58